MARRADSIWELDGNRIIIYDVQRKIIDAIRKGCQNTLDIRYYINKDSKYVFSRETITSSIDALLNKKIITGTAIRQNLKLSDNFKFLCDYNSLTEKQFSKTPKLTEKQFSKTPKLSGRPMLEYDQALIDKCVDTYKKTGTILWTSNKLKLPYSFVRKLLIEGGIEEKILTSKRGNPRMQYNIELLKDKLLIDKCVETYKNLKTITNTSTALKLPYYLVRKLLIKSGINKETLKKPNRPLRQKSRKNHQRAVEINILRNNGLTYQEIGNKFNISRERVRQIFKDYNEILHKT